MWMSRFGFYNTGHGFSVLVTILALACASATAKGPEDNPIEKNFYNGLAKAYLQKPVREVRGKPQARSVLVIDQVITCVIIQEAEEAAMQTLKITTVGNSSGIILPKDVLERLKVSKGDHLYLIEEKDGYRLTPYDKEFVEQMEQAEEIMREDRDVLKVLAK